MNAGSRGTVTVSGGTWANSGNLRVGVLGTGTLTMSGGLVSVAGTLQIGTGGVGSRLAVGDLTNNGTLAFNHSDSYTCSDAISGSGVVTKAGDGTLTLNGGNSFTGGVTISAGSLSLGSANAKAERLITGQVGHLHAMRRYAQAARCRRAALSEYFGQAYGTEPCGAYDVCLDEAESLPDSTVTAQKMISCVARVGERFGVRHVCEVLRGAKTEGIQRHSHDRLSTFGLLSLLDQRTAENLVHQLLDQDLLSRSGGDRPVVALNARSWEVMRGERPVVLLEP